MERKKLPRESKERNINGLTQREQNFCDEYLRCGNISEACIKIGYAKSTAEKKGYELYQRPRVQEYLQAMAKTIESETIATTRELQEELTSIIRCQAVIEEKVNVFVGGGVQKIETVKRQPNGKERLDAIEKMLKMQGAYNKDINVNVKPVVIQDDI